MSIKIKLKGVSDTMASVEEQMSDQIKLQLREVSEEIVEELKAVTPVDTGEARDGWKTTYLDENWMTEDIRIVNPVEHIDELNDGSSVQAPPRFIERTVLKRRDVSPGGIIVRRK